jgi:hypothetical protein
MFVRAIYKIKVTTTLMVKVKTKISGQFKSLQHEFAVIRSVIDSAIKNGQSVFYAINAVIDIIPPPKAAG